MRSLLEAKWATFFDLLKWGGEYEPFDLSGWIPDFVIPGRRTILVDVKPDIYFPTKTARKMEQAVKDTQFARDELLIATSVPFKYESNSPHHPHRHLAIGWLGRRDDVGHWDWGDALLNRSGFAFQKVWGLHSSSNPYDSIHGEKAECKGACSWNQAYSDALHLWIDACNQVQWKRP